MTFRLDGVPALKENIANFNRAVPITALKALDEGADIIRDDARELCPVGTPDSTGVAGYIGGSLRKSIRKEKIARPAGQVFRISVRVGGYIVNPNSGTLVDYHIAVHEGTSKMPGRPFLAMAFERNERKVLNAHANRARRRLF